MYMQMFFSCIVAVHFPFSHFGFGRDAAVYLLLLLALAEPIY